MSGFSRDAEGTKTAWSGRPDWRLDADQAHAYATRLEATGRYRAVCFPLAQGVALVHAEDRRRPSPLRFAFRTAAECEALLRDLGVSPESPSATQLALELPA